MSSTYQLSLDLSNYEKRESASQEQFLKNYEGVFAAFVEEGKMAFKEMISVVKEVPPIQIDPRLRATMLNGLIAGRMMQKYPEKCSRRKHNRPSFLIGGQQVFIKKLNSKLLPSNALTKYNLALRKQLAAPGEEGIPILWMGYIVDEKWKSITGFHAANILEDKVLWSVDIEDHLRGGALPQVVVDIPVDPINGVTPTLKLGGESNTKTGTD